jgi:hypothetical protein
MTRRFAGAVARLAIGLGLACGNHPSLPASPAREGVAIAIYARADGDGYAVIDDRRWVDVAGDTLVLDHVDPRAALPSLMIEPLIEARGDAHGRTHAGALQIGGCLRDRGPAPAVDDDGPPAGSAATALASRLHCQVRGPRGRALVRLAYVVPRPGPQLGYRARHDVAMTQADRATVTSRFAIATPSWQVRAEVALFDGTPGDDRPPRELARGTVVLDGSTAILAAPPRAVAARLRRIYDGAAQVPANVAELSPQRRPSHPAVWVWLELDDLALAPGPAHARIELAGQPPRDLDVPARGRKQAGASLQLPLWIDDALYGKRDRWSEAHDGGMLTDKLAVSVANTGDATRDVWIEEELRPSRRRSVRRAWPSTPSLGKDVLRMKLTVPAGKIERARVEIDYEP